MGDSFSKVGEVFAIEKLNKHQEDSIKYVVEKKKDVFVNLGFGDRVWKVIYLSNVALSVFVSAVHF